MTNKGLQNNGAHTENEVPSVPLRSNRDEKKAVRFVVSSFPPTFSSRPKWKRSGENSVLARGCNVLNSAVST